jgi:hypothetical protein
LRRSDGTHYYERLSLIASSVGGAQVRYIWYRGKRQMIPSTVSSMVGNPLTLPLITGAMLEPLQQRRFLKGQGDGHGAGGEL